MMPEGVVDMLEAIQVKQQNGERQLAAVRCENGLVQVVAEMHPVRQAGQHVMVGKETVFSRPPAAGWSGRA